MKKDRFLLSVSKDCRLVFIRDCKRFTDSFTTANRNQLTSFSCVCYRVGYQTLEFYCRKTDQAFDFKFGMRVGEHIVCLVTKFDQNLGISEVENEVLLNLVRYFEMRHLQSRENIQLCLICLSIAKSMSNSMFIQNFDSPIG